MLYPHPNLPRGEGLVASLRLLRWYLIGGLFCREEVTIRFALPPSKPSPGGRLSRFAPVSEVVPHREPFLSGRGDAPLREEIPLCITPYTYSFHVYLCPPSEGAAISRISVPPSEGGIFHHAPHSLRKRVSPTAWPFPPSEAAAISRVFIPPSEGGIFMSGRGDAYFSNGPLFASIQTFSENEKESSARGVLGRVRKSVC